MGDYPNNYDPKLDANSTGVVTSNLFFIRYDSTVSDVHSRISALESTTSTSTNYSVFVPAPASTNSNTPTTVYTWTPTIVAGDYILTYSFDISHDVTTGFMRDIGFILWVEGTAITNAKKGLVAYAGTTAVDNIAGSIHIAGLAAGTPGIFIQLYIDDDVGNGIANYNASVSNIKFQLLKVG